MTKKHLLLFLSIVFISLGCSTAAGPLGFSIFSAVIFSLVLYTSACRDSSSGVPVVPGITVSAISGDTNETGGNATFTIVLDSQPTSDVEIGLASDDPGEGTVAPANVTFTPGNWNVAQTVTVAGVDDSDVDGNIAYNIITAAAVSDDDDYNGINPNDVSITNVDDDKAYRIFVTDTEYNGNLSGTSGADTLCANNANNPNDGAVFKALIGSSDRNLTQDWVLKASTQYIRLDDNAIIGTTDANAKFTDLNNSLATGFGSPWTGLNDDFSVSSYNCENWAWTGSLLYGMSGSVQFTDSRAWSIGYSGNYCGYTNILICVEQ
ncbi:DUF1554 domain-containing protein [Spirochaetota bacterium]